MGGEQLNLASLSKLLNERQALTETNLSLVLKFKETWSVSTYDAIVETHLLTERELTDILADYFRVTRAYAINNEDIKDDAFEKLTFSDAREWCVFPLGTDEVKGEPKLILGDPTEEGLSEFLMEKFDSFHFGICEKSTINNAIMKHYPITSQLPSLTKSRK